jgi:uncharacterized membrane protein (DUF485 family)
VTGFFVWLLIAIGAGFLGGALAGALVTLGWFVARPNAPPDRR